MEEGKVTEYDKELQTGFGEKRVGRIVGDEGEEFEIRELDKNLQTGFFEKKVGRIVKTSSSGGSGGGSSGDGIGFGLVMIIVSVSLFIVIPYALIRTISESLKDGCKNGTVIFMGLGYGMIVFELFYSKFKWYSILCGALMFGGLFRLSSLNFSNIKVEEISYLLFFFLIPILIEKIRKNS